MLKGLKSKVAGFLVECIKLALYSDSVKEVLETKLRFYEKELEGRLVEASDDFTKKVSEKIDKIEKELISSVNLTGDSVKELSATLKKLNALLEDLKSKGALSLLRF